MTRSGSPESRRPSRRFYGRRKGPRLSPRKRDILARLYARLGLAPPVPEPGALDLEAAFGRGYARHVLEIGFGKGEHLAARAAAEPETGFLGCEPYINGLAAVLDEAERRGLSNLRVYDDDARDILDALDSAVLDTVYLIHPDPWPKRRHAKRRFVNPANLDSIARVLKDDGRFIVVTDDPVYRQWTAIQMNRREDFVWTAEAPADWRTPPKDWVETRYAEKAEQAGRADTFFVYRRVDR